MLREEASVPLRNWGERERGCEQPPAAQPLDRDRVTFVQTLVYSSVPLIPTTGHYPPSPSSSTPDFPNSSFCIPTSLLLLPFCLQVPGLLSWKNPQRGLGLDAAQ